MCEYAEAFTYREEGLGPTKEELHVVSRWKKYAALWNRTKAFITERQV